MQLPITQSETTEISNTTTTISGGQTSLLKRSVMAILGLLFVGIAAVGVVMPGIPTVGPLMLASLFLTKSSPALEKRLVRNHLFAKYLQYLDGTQELSLQAKLTSIGLMWASILISLLVFQVAANTPVWISGMLIIAGLIGTIFIIRFGKKNSGPTNA